MDDAQRDQVAEGVLAYELITQLLANDIAYGRAQLGPVLNLITTAEEHGSQTHVDLAMPIRECAQLLRNHLDKVNQHRRNPGA